MEYSLFHYSRLHAGLAENGTAYFPADFLNQHIMQIMNMSIKKMIMSNEIIYFYVDMYIF